MDGVFEGLWEMARARGKTGTSDAAAALLFFCFGFSQTWLDFVHMAHMHVSVDRSLIGQLFFFDCICHATSVCWSQHPAVFYRVLLSLLTIRMLPLPNTWPPKPPWLLQRRQRIRLPKPRRLPLPLPKRNLYRVRIMRHLIEKNVNTIPHRWCRSPHTYGLHPLGRRLRPLPRSCTRRLP